MLATACVEKAHNLAELKQVVAQSLKRQPGEGGESPRRGSRLVPREVLVHRDVHGEVAEAVGRPEQACRKSTGLRRIIPELRRFVPAYTGLHTSVGTSTPRGHGQAGTSPLGRIRKQSQRAAGWRF